MSSVIVCKSNDIITILAIGEYIDLESKLPLYEKIVKNGRVRLVETSNMNLDEAILNQEVIQTEFQSAFTN